MSGAARFEFLEDVTSDLCFVARGASLAEVFAASADALLAASVDDPSSVGAVERQPVALAEPDRELLLLRFLNELVYLRDARKLLLRAEALEVEETPAGARLRGTLVGERIDPSRHPLAVDVKAATAHALAVAAEGGGFRATVTLDV